MRVLGIESSFDETTASVVELDDGAIGATLLSNEVASSMNLHIQYGGVVPEVAARSHIASIIPVIDKAVQDSHSGPIEDAWEAIDAIAVTHGAGLGGCLLIGVLAARTLAILKHKPLYAINHVEAHVYANSITRVVDTLAGRYKVCEKPPEFPVLALIVSGAHSQLALFRDHFDYALLGQTHDDAIGEAFDKVAKIIGLPYPGGPSVSKKALEGDRLAYSLPKAKMGPRPAHLLGSQGFEYSTPTYQDPEVRAVIASGTYDFSFSGLKTAVLRLAQEVIGEDFTFPSYKLAERLSDKQKADIAASFQRVAIETVVDKTMLAFEQFSPASVVIAGGVAASPELRLQLAERLPIPIAYTDFKLCTDNGAMIATLGCYSALLGRPTADPLMLDVSPNLTM